MAEPRSIHEFSSIEPELESSTSLFLLDVETDDPDYTSGYKTGNATVAEIGAKVIHDTEYPLLLDTVDKSVVGGINENKAVIGYNYDEYDDTTTYAAGDLCIYGNTLYKALQATTGNLPTNPTYWTATSIADELSAKQNSTDNNLSTTNKTVVGAINELKSGIDTYTTDTVTHTSSDTQFKFTKVGHTCQVEIYEDSQVSLPTAWTNIGTINSAFYTSGTGFMVIGCPVIGNHTVYVRINKATGTVDIQCDTASSVWAQGRGIYIL